MYSTVDKGMQKNRSGHALKNPINYTRLASRKRVLFQTCE